MKNFILFLLLLCLAMASYAESVTANTVVTTWVRDICPMSTYNTDSWTVSGSNIYYTSNYGQTIRSPFAAYGDFTFKASLWNADTDNDRYGLVFGYLDSSNHYRLSWDRGGAADAGYTGLQLIQEVNGTNTVLYNNSTLWTADVVYTMMVYRTGNTIGFTITRVSDNIQLFNYSVVNTTFMNGYLGLWNYSQPTYYSNVQYTIVPEPGTIILALFGLMVAACFRGHKKAA